MSRRSKQTPPTPGPSLPGARAGRARDGYLGGVALALLALVALASVGLLQTAPIGPKPAREAMPGPVAFRPAQCATPPELVLILPKA